MNATMIFQIISVVVIPVVVGIIRKIGLPSKWCPIVAFAVALILVGVAKIFSIDLDVNSIQTAIMTALGTAGVAVLGYDTVKKISGQ